MVLGFQGPGRIWWSWKCVLRLRGRSSWLSRSKRRELITALSSSSFGEALRFGGDVRNFGCPAAVVLDSWQARWLGSPDCCIQYCSLCTYLRKVPNRNSHCGLSPDIILSSKWRGGTICAVCQSACESPHLIYTAPRATTGQYFDGMFN